MRASLLTLLALSLFACQNKDDVGGGDGVTTETGLPDLDEDNDGYVADEDCDDLDASVNPGLDEVPYDGLDNDCDESTPDDDLDADGYALADDCDDGDAEINPGADEVCNGLDDNCNTLIDDAVGGVWYADEDADGFGDINTSSQLCDGSSGWVDDATDCDDADAGVNPDALELCDDRDQDCDGEIDEDAVDAPTWYADADADGYGDLNDGVQSCDAIESRVSDSADCDDADPAINPAATELCDGLDNDCDGTIDEDDAADAGTWYADTDDDGFGDPDSAATACALPDGYSADATDCDDSSAVINPEADEICDELDDDCDGLIDEDDAVDAATWYADADEDSFGDISSTTTACAAPDGYTTLSTDCDDGDAAINPDATELCDDVDNDCDGTVDESDAADATTWYEDADRDSYGDATVTTAACDKPRGYAATDGDCDDHDRHVNPAATEVCDGDDNDCDGSIDESDASDAETWYTDADSDGYGDPDSAVLACDAPTGAVSDATDCDDGDATINPDGTELCDDVDNNCDGVIDEDDAADASTWYGDVDDDGYGERGDKTIACDAPEGYVADRTDCNDDDDSINPGATETCDYVDEDCDRTVDDGFRTAGKYTLDSDCGYCGNDCSTYSFDNATASCDTAPSTPSCGFTCDAGFVDVNGDSDDGCECQIISSTDAPFDGIDADCDGIDGDPDDAVHVSATLGSSSGDGSEASPLDSVADGIDLAVSLGLSYVIVTEGTYSESVWLESGVSVYGGFDTSFTTRDASIYTSRIAATGTSASAPGAVSASGITDDTVFDGFTVVDKIGRGKGATTVGIWLENCSDALVISNNSVTAQAGRDGADGSIGDVGDPGATGVVGDTGALTTCTTLTDGGDGGENTCGGSLTDGGLGGDTMCPVSGGVQGDGDDGQPLGGAGGVGACDGVISASNCGLCSIDTSCWGVGQDGDDGDLGADGPAGEGATEADGDVSSGAWAAEDGQPGQDGEYGTGGGGGGAGSGAAVASACGTGSHLGGAGGGGGAGGCGGEGGDGGGGAGGSIGVLVVSDGSVSTLPVLSGNIIDADDGGDGGDGGKGAQGGDGGAGGAGGPAARSTAWCGNDGGTGGDGGNGGAGGGGGGGAGGVSYAVMAIGVTPASGWASDDNVLSYGSAGRGGRGGVGSGDDNDGSDGIDGGDGDQNW